MKHILHPDFSPSRVLPNDPAYNLHEHYVRVQSLADNHPLQEEDAVEKHLTALFTRLAIPFRPINETRNGRSFR